MKVLLMIQLIVTLMMIGVILIQKSEASGLLGSSGGGGGGLFTARGASNLLTRVTAILAAIFMGLCLLMTAVNRHTSHNAASIIYQPNTDQKQG